MPISSSSSTLQSQLRTALDLFILSPETYRAHWLELAGENGIIWPGLKEASSAGDDAFFSHLKQTVSGPNLARAITCFYQLIDCDFVACERLARNFRALIATAHLAAAIRQGAVEDKLLELGRTASASFDVGTGRTALVPDKMLNQTPTDETPSAGVEKLFRQLARLGHYSLAARSWTLFWMDCHDDIESDSSGDIPIVSTPEVGVARFARLSLIRLADYKPSGPVANELVEHPRTALIPFDQRFLDGIQRAWASAGSPPTRWQLRKLWAPQRDDSCSGAAAVAFQHLLMGQQYNPECLVLARVGDDGQRLERVEDVERKFSAAAADPGIQYIIIGKGRAQDDVEDAFSGESLAPPEVSGSSINARWAETVEEAVSLTSVTSDYAQIRMAYLGRYRPLGKLRTSGSDYYYSTKFKKPDDDDELSGILRVRPYQGERPPDVWRLIWDLDLRTLYRISSSPATENCLLQLHDAGVDYHNNAFVALFRSPEEGYETLERAIGARQSIVWLKEQAIKDVSRRIALWKALKRIGQGIAILHSQNIIHGNVSADSVYLRTEDESLVSWRLGGFELSSYLLSQRPTKGGEVESGPSRDRNRRDNWGVPPECAGQTPDPYTFEHDWYGLGMLAARLFLSLTFPPNAEPHIINRDALRKVDERGLPLEADERRMLQQLVDSRRENRFKNWDLILRRLDHLITSLNTLDYNIQRQRGLFVVVRLDDGQLRDTLRRSGYNLPDEMDWNYRDGDHKGLLREAVSQALSGATLYVEPRGGYMAVKRAFSVRLKPYRRDRDNDSETWNLAFVSGTKSQTGGTRSMATSSLDGEEIVVMFNREAKDHRGGRSWKTVLPSVEKPDNLPPLLDEFHSFLVLMNECELLMRAAEIFPCRVESLTESDSAYERLRIFPEHDDRLLPKWCQQASGGMVKSLYEKQLDLDSEAEPLKVHLTPDDMFTVAREHRLSPWEIEPITDEWHSHIIVTRERDTGHTILGDRMFLRLTDHWGQVELVRRRKKAIENLRQHVFLLKALVRPSEVVMDPTIKELPYSLQQKMHEVDKQKIAVLQDILASRPIYALQGPPGTGKTVLVAQLLRQILEDDPVAQVLVTSQAHPAVNVLMERVFRKGFFGDKRPIIIRLGLDKVTDNSIPGTAEHESHQILDDAWAKLREKAQESDLDREWHEVIQRLSQQHLAADDPRLARFREDLRRLVKRSASITFSTTSAGELEDLADQKLSYDWSIIEEAGRAHGFDLALPMQAGHRWMLLGDQAQLTPYRHKFFDDCVKNINETIKALESLTAGGSGLIDRNNLSRISGRLEEDPEAVRKEADIFLKMFERLHKVLSKAQGKELVTTGESPVGANAGRLTRNYRMHPHIGDLISNIFYQQQFSKIENYPGTALRDGSPRSKVIHRLLNPAAFAGRPIVWVNIPWRATREGEGAPGTDQEKNYDNEVEADTIISLLREFIRNVPPEVPVESPPFSAGEEESDNAGAGQAVVTLAVLSPYTRQRDLVAKRIQEAGLKLDGWLQFRAGLRGRRRNRPPTVHTVDSFQGNEAQIVILSLVRNNNIPPNENMPALGFLKEKERLNVMLSRAEHLLVLIGSWEFFVKQLSTVDRTSPLVGEMRQLFEHLEDLFDTGRAAFVDYVNFESASRPGSLKKGDA